MVATAVFDLAEKAIIAAALLAVADIVARSAVAILKPSSNEAGGQ